MQFGNNFITMGRVRRPGLATLNTGGGWTPLALGADLYDMWDAERVNTLSLSGAAVNSWASVKNAYSAAQEISAAKPVYSATGLNGRPCVTADGLDDELTFADVGVFPVGANGGELWLLVDQLFTVVENTASQLLFAYGGIGTGDRVGIVKTVDGGSNRARGSVASSANVLPPAVDFTGIHVVRLRFGSPESVIGVDGTDSTPTATTPATGTTRTRLFANTGNTPAGFAKARISLAALTAPLTTEQASQMMTFLKTRGGIA